MRIKVLTTNGVELVEADALTFHEHEAVIDHWEDVFRGLHERGVYDDAKLEQKLAMVRRGRQRLYAGKIPTRRAS